MSTNAAHFVDYFKLSFPIFVYLACSFLQSAVNIIIISHKYADHKLISAIGMTSMYTNITTYSIIIGLLSGIDTLSSTATGKRDFQLATSFVTKGQATSCIFLVSVYFFHFLFLNHIFDFLLVDEKVKQLAFRQIFLLFPYFVVYIFSFSYSKLISIIGHSYINYLLGIASILLQPFISFTLISCLDLGLPGVALSMFVVSLLIIIIELTWFNYICPINLSFLPTIATCLTDLSFYLSVAIPNSSFILSKWWASEIQAIFLLSMPPIELTVFVITFNINLIIDAWTLALSAGNAILIGKSLGDTRKTTKDLENNLALNMIFALCSLSVIGIICETCRDMIAGCYTSDEVVKSAVKSSLKFALLHQVLKGANEVLEGFFKSVNDQRLLGVTSFVVHYVIQSAASYFWGIKQGLGVDGVWMGFVSASAVMTVVLVVYYRSRDLDKLKKVCLEKLGKRKLSG